MGRDDEIGAFNLLNGETVRTAAGLVHEGRVLSLAQPLSSATPVPPLRCGFAHFMTRNGGDYLARASKAGDFGFADDTIVTPLHIGAHIDALCHAWRGDALYNGFASSTVRSSGAARCGIEKMPPFVGRGLLLDVAASRTFADGEAVDRDDLAAALDAARENIRAGDAVLIRTGWLERQAGRASVDFNAEPGLDVEAAAWLADAGAALVGADNFAIEQMPFPEGQVFPVHQRLLCDYGVPLLEGLLLAPLAARGRASFLLVVAPLPIVGGTGSPVTPLAIL